MIGQQKLVNWLNTITISALPHALILAGEYGCGKHLFIAEVCNKFNIDLVDISNEISPEFVADLASTSNITMYVIDSTQVKYKDQNILLKLLEEPSEYIYFCILCQSIEGLYDTIRNRCQIFTFEPYTNEELFLVDASINKSYLSILNTPGKILNTTIDLSKYYNCANKIFNYIDIAVVSNMLVLLDKVSYNNKDDTKLSIDIFSQVLNEVAFNLFKTKMVPFSAIQLTTTFANDLLIFNIDKEKLYERFLLDLKYELKRYKTKVNSKTIT